MKKIIIFALLLSVYACGNRHKELIYSVDKLKITELKTVDDVFRKKNLDLIPVIKDNLAGDYNAFYLDEKNLAGYSFITVYVTRDAFGIIFLLIFNKDKLISYEELAGGICAGPNEENDTVYWCSESFSKFENDKDFQKTTVKKKSNDFANSPLFIDTIKGFFSIQSDGSIKLLRSDSVRVVKQLNEHGKEG